MKNSDTFSQWHQAGLWGQETGSGTGHSFSGPVATESAATDMVADVCASFARMLDWKAAVSIEAHARKFVLTENHGRGQEECHAELRASPAEDELRVRGVLYDSYRRTIVVRDQCVPLSWADRHRLGELLTQTVVSLKRHRGVYSGSDSALTWF